MDFLWTAIGDQAEAACLVVQGGLGSIFGEGGAVIPNFCRLMGGAWLTLQLTALALAIGFLLAVPVAMARLSKNPWINYPCLAYTFYFRGTPLLVQLFLVYYGSGQFALTFRELGLWHGMFRDAYFCALLTLTLNTAAYTAEILRGGMLGVPAGEVEAGRAYGMSRATLYRRIVFPRAMRIALPAYTNEVVFLFQATSLVSLVTLLDLMGVARDVISGTFRTFETLIFAGLVYLVISGLIFAVFKRVERRLMRHRRDITSDTKLDTGAKPGAPTAAGQP
ncbi:MAG: ABC transporter permease [Pseudomonadota bacterium]